MCESCCLQFSRRLCDLEDMLSETELTKKQSKIDNLVSGFSKGFSTLGLIYGFLSKSLRFHIAFQKRWTKVSTITK
jgi:hypothetical protein